MITLDELIRQLEVLRDNGTSGDTPVVIDAGMCLCEVEEVDLGTEGEGVLIWAGDLVE